MKTIRFLSLPLLVSALTSACASLDESSSSAAGAVSETVTYQPVAARDWATCQTEAAGTKTKVICQSTDVAGYPLTLDTINVSISDHNDADIVSGGRASTRPVTVDTLEAADFPVTVTLKVTVAEDPTNDGSGLGGKDLTTTFVLASPEAGATPKVFRQPFDLWPIAISESVDPHRSDILQVDFSLISLGAYAAPLGDFHLSANDQNIHPAVPTDNPAVMYLPAPQSNVVSGSNRRFTDPTAPPISEQAIEIRQAGLFITEASGFRPATTSDRVNLPRAFPFVAPAPAQSAQ